MIDARGDRWWDREPYEYREESMKNDHEALRATLREEENDVLEGWLDEARVAT